MGSGASKENLSNLNVVIIGAGYAGTAVSEAVVFCYFCLT
jgi:malic enzyme